MGAWWWKHREALEIPLLSDPRFYFVLVPAVIGTSRKSASFLFLFSAFDTSLLFSASFPISSYVMFLASILTGCYSHCRQIDKSKCEKSGHLDLWFRVLYLPISLGVFGSCQLSVLAMLSSQHVRVTDNIWGRFSSPIPSGLFSPLILLWLFYFCFSPTSVLGMLSNLEYSIWKKKKVHNFSLVCGSPVTTNFQVTWHKERSFKDDTVYRVL